MLTDEFYDGLMVVLLPDGDVSSHQMNLLQAALRSVTDWAHYNNGQATYLTFQN
jgi:hypothetical protein